jgi:hypothetical protein
VLEFLACHPQFTVTAAKRREKQMAKAVLLDSPRGQCLAFTAYAVELVQAIAQAPHDDKPVLHLEQQPDFAARGLVESFAAMMEGKCSRRDRDDKQQFP